MGKDNNRGEREECDTIVVLFDKKRASTHVMRFLYQIKGQTRENHHYLVTSRQRLNY